jgi:peptidoglycan/LPS O-acetylase OafA/YrhL
MSDFNPVTLFFILSESLGIWLWAFLALALLLLAGIAAGVARLRRSDQPARRALKAAVLAGLATTIVFAFLVPVWTLAGPGALGAPIDILFAVLFALVPGVALGSAGRAAPGI